MSANLKPYKGTRDFYPEDQRRRQYIFNVWSKLATNYAFEAYDSSLIEPLSLYQLKHQTNPEIINQQIYDFKDRANRQLALRPEMTPTVSRLVAARRQQLNYPLRWFSIPNLWRYERPQRGRLREHWQLNLDIFGVEGVEAEHELILISRDILRGFGAKDDDFQVRISDRNFIQQILTEQLGCGQDKLAELIQLLDKHAKLSQADFKASYQQLQLPDEGLASLLELLKVTSFEQLPAELQALPTAVHLKQLFKLLEASNFTNCQLDLSIVRGFDYYSGIVFEVFDTDSANNRSLIGGGRYDQLVGSLGVEDLPTVGLGMGDVTTADFLTAHDLWPDLTPSNQLYLVIQPQVYASALPILEQLRSSGLRPILDTSGRNLSKLIPKIAKRASWLLVIGPKEIQSGQFNLKHLVAQTQASLDLNQLIARIKSHDH